MTRVIRIHDAQGYRDVVRHVISYGQDRAPRRMKTLDLGHTTIVLANSARAMPLGMGRGLNPAIGAVEAIQLIAGVQATQLVLKVAPQFGKYKEEDESDFHGAYGQRISMQVCAAIGKLREDPNTRQAVITLWDPWLDNLPGKRDYPCTVTIGFKITHVDEYPLLEMDVLMRSNDVWTGLPYDMFQFTQLQHSVAASLGMIVGEYRHTTWSLHLYESNREAAETFLALDPENNTYHNVYQPYGIGSWNMGFLTVMQRAQAIITNTLEDPTASEKWYVKQLHGDKNAD
jgi:thymidylate synthase